MGRERKFAKLRSCRSAGLPIDGLLLDALLTESTSLPNGGKGRRPEVGHTAVFGVELPLE
jgi:hypothetical protein